MEIKEIRNTDRSVISDLRLSQKNYSPMRDISAKWISEPLSYTPTLDPSIEYIDETHLPPSRQNITSQGFNKINTLSKRQAIKTNPLLFSAIYSFWQLINPFHLRGISRDVYIKINEYIYLSVLNSVKEPAIAKKYAEQDADCDFGGSSFLVFSEFYDSMFELVDACTRSKLVSEYSRVVKSINIAIQNLYIYNPMNLHSKLHLKNDDGSKVVYKPWMIAILSSGQEEKLPALLRDSRHTEFVKGGPTHLAERRSLSRKKSDVGTVNRHIKRFIMINQRIATSKPSISKTPTRLTPLHKINSERSAFKPRLAANEKIRSEYISRVSPISVEHLKLGHRTADLLEKVIEGRRLYKESKDAQI